MKRMLAAIAISAATLAAPGAGAQTWTGSTEDYGARIYGSVREVSRDLAIVCNAPSPQGRALFETGEHENLLNEPYELHLYVPSQYFDWQPPYVMDTAVLYLGQTGYLLPPFELNELQGTAVRLSMADQMVQALADAPSLVLDTGQGTAYEYGTDGLGPALQTAMQYCVARWRELGYPEPAGLGAFAAAGTSTAVQPTALYGPAPQQAFAIPQSPPQNADAHVRGRCQGGYDIDPARIRSADFDGDGQPDFIVDWNDLTCMGSIGPRPFCGAALCSIDVFMSSLGYRAAPEMLGIGVTVVTLPNGQPGFISGSTAANCADGSCDIPFFWNGREFTR